MTNSTCFKYTIKAHPTMYKSTLFRSRLEARWAAFFDMIGWCWEYEPIDIEGWTPDFKVSFPCINSNCSHGHRLLIEVKPYQSIDEFKGHPCTNYTTVAWPLGCYSAAFGLDPSVTEWDMAHGAGSTGEIGLFDLCENYDTFWWRGCTRPPGPVPRSYLMELWAEAGNITRYKHPKEKNGAQDQAQDRIPHGELMKRLWTSCVARPTYKWPTTWIDDWFREPDVQHRNVFHLDTRAEHFPYCHFYDAEPT